MLHAVHTTMYDQYTAHLSSPWPDPELRVSTVGFFEGKGSFDYRQIPRTVSFHVVLAGSGTVTSEGDGPRRAATGDVFVFFPGRAVHYRESPTAPWRYLWFYLQGRRATEVLASLGIAAPRCVYPGIGGRLAALAPRWRAELEAGTPHAAADLTYAWEAAGALYVPGAGTPPTATPDVVDICRGYLESHYMNPIGIEEVARHCGVDRTTLFRRFRERCGQSPKQYLQDLRLQRARHLLLTTERQSVAAVAAASGFSSPAYFARVFRERAGLSPGEWRARGGPRHIVEHADDAT